MGHVIWEESNSYFDTYFPNFVEKTYPISNLKSLIQPRTHHDTSEWKLTALFGLEQFVTFSSKTQIIRSPVKRVTFEVLAASGSSLI